MIGSGKFNDKKFLLIDKEPKTKNDRTWCFWEKQAGFFDEIVYKKWDELSFLSDEFSNTMDISPYQYKMIRGIDFYNYCFGEVKQHSNIEVLYGHARIEQKENDSFLYINDQRIEIVNAIVFNSFADSSVKSGKEISLLQHFKGWIIETSSKAFDPNQATFMDFRVDQSRGTTFAYVLPFSKTKAMIEYTLFTENILADDEYENELKKYIDSFLNIKDYKITEKEFGIIPMTTRSFDFYKNSIYNIGTVGGQTKASSGYTFQFIQKQSDLILQALLDDTPLKEVDSTSKRFLFYDKILLNVLQNKRVTGKEIFTTMFKKNKPQQVLKFLDNESSLAEELKIISTLPSLPFLKAAINQL
jgi:lycopene beta-cyclase